MGKMPRLLQTRDKLGRSVMMPSVLGQLGRPVACQAACSGASASRYAGCTQALGWAGEKVSAHGRDEK
jgi:hypothetical protein